MSIEATNDNSLERALLETVEGATLDPLLKQIFDKMRLYNELLATESQSEPEINAIMHEIDAEWQGLIGQKITYTGLASFLDERDLSPDVPPIRSYYEEHEMIFRGVIPHETRSDEASDKKFYELRVLFEREAIDNDGNLIGLRGSASLEDIASFEFMSTMSTARARRILELHVPELIEDIDCALLNDVSNESELFERLVPIATDEESFSVFDDESFVQLKSALDVYTNSHISCDQAAPYRVQLDGFVWYERREDDIVAATVPGIHELARIENVVWNRLYEDGPRTIRPMLNMYLLANDKDGAETHLYVPLSTLKHLTSIRHEFYSGSRATDGAKTD